MIERVLSSPKHFLICNCYSEVLVCSFKGSCLKAYSFRSVCAVLHNLLPHLPGKKKKINDVLLVVVGLQRAKSGIPEQHPAGLAYLNS